MLVVPERDSDAGFPVLARPLALCRTALEAASGREAKGRSTRKD